MATILDEISEIKALLSQQYLSSKKVLSLREAAIYMDISEDALYKLTGNRLIPHSKPGGKKVYFDKDEIDKWLLSNKVKTIIEIQEEADIFIVKRRSHSQ